MQNRHDRSTTQQIGEAHIDDTVAHQVVSVEPVAIAWSTFVDGDTTPDINSGSYWKEANTGATTITNFDNPKTNIHKITILFTTTNTTITHNANIYIQARSDFTGAVDDVKVFLWDGTNWVEQAVDVPLGYISKGVLLNWDFKMVDADNFATPVTGETVSVTISKNGSAFANLTGSPAVSEIGFGWYAVAVPAVDMDYARVILRATATNSAQHDRAITTG